MDPQRITELAKLLRDNGDKILNSEFTLTLSGSLLRALNDSFTLIADSVEIGAPNKHHQETFQVVKPNNSKSNVFRDLQLVHDFVQKTALLCIIHYPTEHYFEGTIDIGRFHALKRLEVQKTNVRQIIGIQPLRSQIQQLICVKSLHSVDDIITRCGGDNSNGFVWNELKTADFSYNNLQAVDTSLEFAQYLQHLNLRHNKLHSVQAIKWLPHLKTLDLSYNCLQSIPQFHMEANKRLQLLNICNNYIEDLMGLAKLDALTDLDLSDNCLLDHSYLLPLSALVTLKCLNLYGNPLHYHPKHRLATAQYLHKNTSTVKFILDYEPLAKNEKALTGTHQLRHVGALNKYATRSSSTSINSGRLTSTSSNTPASSVGSLRSFKFHDSHPDSESQTSSGIMVESFTSKRRSAKKRTVDFEEDTADKKDENLKDNNPNGSDDIIAPATTTTATKQDTLRQSSMIDDSSVNDEHLTTKKHIESLRKKYGAEWLQSGNAEMMQSVLGVESPQSKNTEGQRENSRQMFNDYLGELSETNVNSTNVEKEDVVISSTPTDSSINQKFESTLTPIKSPITNNNNNTNSTIYQSLKSNSPENKNDIDVNDTLYSSALSKSTTESLNKNNETETTPTIQVEADDNTIKGENEEKDEHAHLKYVYASSAQTPDDESDEIEISDTEPDEDCYIVYNSKRSTEPIFFTISSKFLREKDTITQRTKTKWSIKILESCERLKSNMLSINFDTVKQDKQERIYTVEDDLCQELERKLRAILSERDLTEMNITIYRCVNCGSQFTREQKQKHYNTEPRCPDCRSTFVAEIHDIPKSLEKHKLIPHSEKLSPAAIVEESPISTPLVVQTQKPPLSFNESPTTAAALVATAIDDDKNSIGSANSLNESSSCSKITNSQCSYDSNQSVVGSSNTERELEFRNNYCESDVDIISNPSQSSIEVLDQNSSRQASEERPIPLSPTLDNIDDRGYTQSFIEREFGRMPSAQTMSISLGQQQLQHRLRPQTSGVGEASVKVETTNEIEEDKVKSAATASPNQTLSNLLTESSSSGSVTDSICTTYEHTEKQKAATTSAITKEKSASSSSVDKGSKADSHNQLLPAEHLDANAPSCKNSNKVSENNVAEPETNGIKKEDAGLSSMFGALFQSTNILMSSSKKLIDAEATANIKTGLALPPGTISQTPANINNCQPYKFNYMDFNDIDHRLKLYFYQTKFEEAGEHFKWLARGRIFNEQTQTLCDGLIVMTTCKLYVMEAYAPENDDVTKWLRQVVSVTTDRLTGIQLLPWKIGLAFKLRSLGGFLLLLQDILRTDSLLLYFANSTLPSTCSLNYQPAAQILKRLNSAVMDEQIKMFSLLNGCQISCDNAKRSFNVCALLATDTNIFLTSEEFNWLSVLDKQGNEIPSDNDADRTIEFCMTQLMSNLVDVERSTPNVYIINFLDETQNICELWELNFETQENAESCLNAIGQSWEQLFGVPLLNA